MGWTVAVLTWTLTTTPHWAPTRAAMHGGANLSMTSVRQRTLLPIKYFVVLLLVLLYNTYYKTIGRIEVKS